MPIKTPKFWYKDPKHHAPLIEKLMTPLSVIYELGSNLNLRRTIIRNIDIPVICIGNITAGGSGKTPVIIAIQKLINKNKLFNNPYFLSRGYGGSTKDPRRITAHDDASETGDEPLLLASHSNTIISVNRYSGAKLAYELGADIILMDDGFQNQSLYKDLSFIVIDGKMGLGNKKLIPAGPLREPIDKAFKRAHAVIIIGEDKTNTSGLIPENMPIFNAYITPSNIDNLDINASYVAFAGLAHPQKFRDTLLENSINVVAFHEFADHHNFSNKEIDTLINDAKNIGAKLITTEKDYARISDKYREYIDYFPIELIFENEQDIANLIRKIAK